MKYTTKLSGVLGAGAVLAVLAACVPIETRPGVQVARDKLTALQSDPVLAPRAPAAIREAEEEVAFAEAKQYNSDYDHRALTYVANRKVDIARAQAETQLAQDQVAQLDEQRQQMQMAVRRPPDPTSTTVAPESVSAQQQAQVAMLEVEDYRRQMSELGALSTGRGMLMILSGLSISDAQSDLVPDSQQPRLDQLAAFLQRYPHQTVLIEGHTDDAGDAAANRALSLRRAEAVKRYLTARGIAAGRLETAGRGAEMPAAGDSTEAGRQQNRRVEIVIRTPLSG